MTEPIGSSSPDDDWRSRDTPSQHSRRVGLPQAGAGMAARLRGPESLPPQPGACMRWAVKLCVAVIVAMAAGACDGSSPPKAASSPPTPASSPSAAGSRLHFPAQLLGLHKNSSPAIQGAIRALTAKLATDRNNLRSPQGAFYGGTSGPAMVVYGALFTGAAARAAKSVSASFDQGFAKGFAKSTGSSDLRSFPAGPHGGALYCGHQTRNSVPAITCAWADKMRAGAVIYFREAASSLSDAASKMNQVRAAIEP
jgi:hypothetical protein